MKYQIALGADHRGFALKQQIGERTEYGEATIAWQDVGTDSAERTDYPIYAHRVVNLILKGEVEYGILICGSGIGESIAANRFPHIYAGLVWKEEVARVAKEHDNVNLLILPADYLTLATAQACITAWLSATFREGRYQERLDMIENYKP